MQSLLSIYNKRRNLCRALNSLSFNWKWMAKTCVCSGRRSSAAGLRFGQLFWWFDEAEMQNEGNGKITVFIVCQSGRKHWGAIKLHNKAEKRAKGRASQPNACQIKSHSLTYTYTRTYSCKWHTACTCCYFQIVSTFVKAHGKNFGFPFSPVP